MHDCNAIESQLSEFAAGNLPRTDAVIVAAHLAACGSCRAEFDREQELRAILQELPLVTCPTRVSRALQRRVDLAAGLPAARRSRRWPASLGLVAAALLAVLLVPGLSRRTDRPLPTEAAGAATSNAQATTGYTASEVNQARRDAVVALQLAASVLDRSRDRAVVDVFGSRLPRAISGALRPVPHQSPITDQPPQSTIPGGNG
jgi:anti-sigma factor RsiW